MKRSAPVGGDRPHLCRKGDLWQCFTAHGSNLLRVGRGYTPGTAYDKWQLYPGYLVERDVYHRTNLTPVSNSPHVVTE